MVYNRIKNILPVFRFEGTYIKVDEMTSGNINSTYHLHYRSKTGKINHYTLQNINNFVFKDPMAAMMGGALRLHPRIGVTDGKMAPGKKYRGKMDRVILTYATEMEADLRAAKADRVFITHSGCPEETIAPVREWLQGLNHFQEIHVTRAGGVISTHCGPGTLGVLFIAGE